METDIKPILESGIKSIEDVQKACEILRKYWNGFVLAFNGESYYAEFFPSHISVQPVDASTQTSPKASFGGGNSFGSAMNEVHTEGVLGARMREEKRKFALECQEGGSFLNANVGGRTVTWLQHGRVFSYNEEIGTYDDKGVQNGKRHMIISINDEMGPEDPTAERLGVYGRNIREMIEWAKNLSREKMKPVSFEYEGISVTMHQKTPDYEIISQYNNH